VTPVAGAARRAGRTSATARRRAEPAPGECAEAGRRRLCSNDAPRARSRSGVHRWTGQVHCEGTAARDAE
jgi:hypothetical protein